MQDVSQDAGGCISVPRAVTSLLMAFRNSTAHQGCPPPRHEARYLNTILATMHGGGLQKGGHAHFKLGSGGRESEAHGAAAPNWPRKHPVSFLQLQDSAIKAASDSALIHIFAFFFQCGLQFKQSHMHTAPSRSLPLFMHQGSSASASNLTLLLCCLALVPAPSWSPHPVPNPFPQLCAFQDETNEVPVLVASCAWIFKCRHCLYSQPAKLFYLHPTIKPF